MHNLEYSQEDGCYCGKVVGLPNDLILYEGHTLDELKKDFEVAIDGNLAIPDFNSYICQNTEKYEK